MVCSRAPSPEDAAIIITPGVPITVTVLVAKLARIVLRNIVGGGGGGKSGSEHTNVLKDFSGQTPSSSRALRLFGFKEPEKPGWRERLKPMAGRFWK
jgi:hypothetical protein